MRNKKAILEFYILFIKNALSYKISFFWTIIMPTVFLIWRNPNWFKNSPSETEFYSTIVYFCAYIILIVAGNGFGVGLLSLRENNFLKMFKFISGSKSPVIIGHFLAQGTFLFLNIIIFTGTMGALFASSLLLKTLTAVLIVGLLTILPIFLFFMWVPSLKLKVESVSPIFSLLPILLVYLAGLRSENEIIELLSYLNPIKLVIGIAFKTSQLLSITSTDFPTVSWVLVIVIPILYISIGIVFINRIDLRSFSVRS
ncbi:hypothetical protein [Falsibacillus pallidus]|uniref:hypothetical protein n=1 Tax=Falsibacillus pallidus TaxID=493781 RepID=UPI003D9766BB